MRAKEAQVSKKSNTAETGTERVDRVTRAVVAKLWAERTPHRPVGIRDVAIEVEERLGEVTLDEIHAALLRVALLYPAADLSDARAQRQLGHAWIPPGAPETEARVWVAPPDLMQKVRDAYLRVTAGELGRYVRLAELRSRLPGQPRDAVDAVLRELQRQGQAVLYPIDDPQRIRREDNEAAIRVAGERRDLLCLKR